MAIIQAEFNTENKSLVVRIDEEVVEDATGISFNQKYDDHDKYGCEISIFSNGDDDIMEFRRLCSAQTEQAQAALADGTGKESAAFPGFVEVPDQVKPSKAEADIADFFGVTE
jgi:hypothetical protein